MARPTTRRRFRLGVERLEERSTPAIFTVTSPADGGPGSLRQAVAAANMLPGPDLIRFQIPTTQPGPVTITLTSGEIAITDSLNVIGYNVPTSTTPPPTAPPMINISGNNASRIFNINGPAVLFANFAGLGFVNGKTTGSGGAVLDAGKNVTFTGCTFTNNTATGNGGAVEVGRSAATTLAVGPTVTFNYTRLVGNRATDGGAVHFSGPGGLAVGFSTFDSNVATGHGGGVSLAAGGRVSIDSSTISNNSAATSGGGVQYVGGPPATPVAGAAVLPLFVRNSTFSGNDAGVRGGGFALESFSNGPLVVANSTVTNNAAGNSSPILTTAGGGIFVGTAAGATTVGKVSLVSSVLSGNRAAFGADAFTPGSLSAAYSALGSSGGIATYVDGGHNLPFGVDLKLGPLADNGGPTLTHLPAADSPLVDHGSNPFGLRFDQRGFPFRRVQGPAPDIGSVERPQPQPVAGKLGDTPVDGLPEMTGVDVVVV
jgi:predicted outer membrane repeat protein